MIRVLIVDDSAVIRRVLATELAKFPDIEVCGTANDPYEAREQIAALRPDVITLDVEMPKMDGIAFLEKLMRSFPLPVIIVSSLTPKHSTLAVRALALGAVDVICKPGSSSALPDVAGQLVHAIRAAATARIQPLPSAAPAPTASAAGAPSRPAVAGAPGVRAASTPAPTVPKALVRQAGQGAVGSRRLVALGASTGGTQALEAVLTQLPATTPGTVIVQHMPPVFTKAFAERLDKLCAMTVVEAQGGELVTDGVVFIAPGGHHMVLAESPEGWRIAIKDGPPVHHQRPAVDVLFQSVARLAGARAVGAVLTGMGADGAAGLRAMRDAGARTCVQDEATCVVFGMPKEAIAAGAAERVVPLSHVPATVLELLRDGPARA